MIFFKDGYILPNFIDFDNQFNFVQFGLEVVLDFVLVHCVCSFVVSAYRHY